MSTTLAEVMAKARDALPTVGEREDVWCSVRGDDLRFILDALEAAHAAIAQGAANVQG